MYLQHSMIRRKDLVLRVALGHFVGSDDVVFQLVKRDLRQEDIVGDLVRPLETSAVHVVAEDGLEARPVSVEEVLLPLGVVELTTLVLVAEQRVRMACEHLAPELVVLSAHVHAYSVAVL